jgi:hypothetical protein
MPVPRVLNLDCFTTSPKREHWLAKARGFATQVGDGPQNGGIANPQREHLMPGQYYYRFVSASIDPAYKIGGVWWMDFSTLKNIYSRFQATGPNERTPRSSGPASSTFREWLALTIEWNLIEEIVIAPLQARLDGYSGFGRLAKGNSPDDTRTFGYATHLSNLFSIKQFCVPELWIHQKQAFPSYRIMPFSQIESVVDGKTL